MKVLEYFPDLLQDKFRDSFSSLNDWEQSMIVSSLQRVARFIDAEQIDAAPIIDYGELNQEPSEFKDLVEESTTSEDFKINFKFLGIMQTLLRVSYNGSLPQPSKLMMPVRFRLPAPTHFMKLCLNLIYLMQLNLRIKPFSIWYLIY